MADIHVLDVVTRIDIPVSRVVENIPTDMESLVVMGWDSNGELYFASSLADGGDVLWLLEKSKKLLLEY